MTRRLPFDPNAAAGSPSPRSGASPARREKKTLSRIIDASQLTVSQLSELIKSTLEQRIPSPLRVVGEVSNLSTPNHWYFSLKDDASVVSCVAWASAAKKFGFTPSDGDEVVATGHVSHYGPQGRTQLYVSKLEPVGAGALELRFRAMCEELRQLGYFDPDRKKPLPAFPRRIAVITAATGAAVQDVINTAAHRCRAVGLLIVNVKVQGEGAADQVARAIRWVDSRHERLGIDAILVTRGGGSIEDLWAFNERVVADAVFACSLPVVAAIGHESDTTVIELVADLRAATPTQAAMRLVPDSRELHKQIDHLANRLAFLARRRIEQAWERLDHLARHAIFRRPEQWLRQARERLIGAVRHLERSHLMQVHRARARLEHLAGRMAALRPHALVTARHQRVAVLEDRLNRAVRRHIDQHPAIDRLAQQLRRAHTSLLRDCRERLQQRERELNAIDPRHVLRRGFSYTTKPDGMLVRSTGDVRAGETMRTHVADGMIDSIVGSSIARPRRRRSRGASETDADQQMDLFDAGE